MSTDLIPKPAPTLSWCDRRKNSDRGWWRMGGFCCFIWGVSTDLIPKGSPYTIMVRSRWLSMALNRWLI
ncbi:hypothetical protein [Coleofasciculus sp. E1-EBD-02]|uniref:hypothetical protein n=1 Tax=Coleofasciculus sp. E1-EBD-02 TaxID=3068481 RepID=UPI0033007D34